MPSRWCPWCGAEISAGAESGDLVCAACGTKVPANAALSAPPRDPLKPGDPEAQLPPGAPEGAAPLPAGAPTMSNEALLRWAVVFGAVLLAVAALGFAVVRPLLSYVRTPAPASATPASTATTAATPPP